MGTISKNFSYSEFERSETADKHDICNVITTVAVRDCIKALVDNVLQPLRDAWGEPLTVNSGYRCPALNAIVPNSSPTSQHVKGEAADIAAENPHKLAQHCYDLGLPFDQMILYPNFVHISHHWNGPQRGRILYNWRYNGPKVIEN